MTSSQSDLNVLLVLLGIGWVDFSVPCSDKLVEQVGWLRFGGVKLDLHVVVELLSERVAIVDVEDSVVEINVDSHVQISPGVVVRKFADNSG